jgi:type VI secretion system protein ImpB
VSRGSGPAVVALTPILRPSERPHMPDSYQDTLKRVRPPRVRIDYKVETEGAEPVLELPFVVGVMADLSAQSTQEKKVLKQRKFTPIDRDNFNDVMARAAPRVSFRVPNKLSDKPDELLNVELNFKSMDDFDPARIVEQVPVLNELLQMRKKLTELLGKMEGNDALEKLLTDVLGNTEKKQALMDALAKSDDEPKSE